MTGQKRNRKGQCDSACRSVCSFSISREPCCQLLRFVSVVTVPAVDLQPLANAPFIVADDGELLQPRHVCTDLFSDLGPRSRALPLAYSVLVSFLNGAGCLTASDLAAPEVRYRCDAFVT